MTHTANPQYFVSIKSSIIRYLWHCRRHLFEDILKGSDCLTLRNDFQSLVCSHWTQTGNWRKILSCLLRWCAYDGPRDEGQFSFSVSLHSNRWPAISTFFGACFWCLSCCCLLLLYPELQAVSRHSPLSLHSLDHQTHSPSHSLSSCADVLIGVQGCLVSKSLSDCWWYLAFMLRCPCGDLWRGLITCWFGFLQAILMTVTGFVMGAQLRYGSDELFCGF